MWCHQPGHLARECVNPCADSSDIPDDHPADTPSVGTPSEVAQPTPPSDSNNLSNDSPTSVSSRVLFDSADVSTAMREDVSPAGFPGGDDDISDSFSVDSISEIDQSGADKERSVKESNINLKQGTGNVEQSGNVELSGSNVVQSMNNEKDNEQSMNNDKDIEQNTVTVEQSTSNVVQSSINVEQSVDVVNNNSDKCSSINVEQNIDDECNIVNVVADSQPVESLSFSEDPPAWAEVVAMEEAATFTEPAPSMEPVQERKTRSLCRSISLLVLAFLCAFVRPPVRWPTLRGRPNLLLRVFFSLHDGFLFFFQFSSLWLGLGLGLKVRVRVNVDGLRHLLKRATLLQWLHAAPSVDVVCLQEVHCVSESECQFWLRSSGFSFCVSPGSNRSCGSIVLFRPSLSLVASWSDSEGRLLLCVFQFRGVRFRVISL